MPTLTVERTIAAPPAAVFDWLADPANLKHAPMVLRVGVIRLGASAPYGVGARREVTTAGAWFREEITAYDPPHVFGYRILASVPPIEHDGGEVRVAPVPGGAHVVWTTTFRIAPARGGRPLEAVLERALRGSFGAILAAAERELTGGGPSPAAHAPFAVANRVLNPALAAVLRSPAHALLSGSLALVTVTGRRSGRTYTFPVMYRQDGDAVTIAVAAPSRKRWWRNVRGGAPITLRLHGADRTGHATAEEGADGSVTVAVRLDAG